MSCPICYEDMDMREFNDPNVSTDTCFKLECGHAYHTRCIVEFLTRTEHKCPSCNQHKTPTETVELDGVIVNAVKQIKKDDRVRLAKHEYQEARSEYKAVISQLRNDVREWAKTRCNELKFAEHKNYYNQAASNVTTTAKTVATELGPSYVGALKSGLTARMRGDRWSQNLAKKELFGTHVPGYRDWRLRNPTVWFRI